jgi:regulatory protein
LPKKDPGISLKIKEYAFLLLKYRLRSEAELCQRLKKKKFPEDEIKKLLSFLRQKGFVDDESFARAWINARLRQPLGLRRIRQELKLKGIPKDIAEDKILEASRGYCESKIVEELARDKLERLSKVEPVKARNRVYAYLIRRGFSADKVMDALNSICKQTY